MIYVNVEFPRHIAFGAQRRAGWKTSLAQTGAGFESANQDWARARHRYDVGFAVRTAADYHAITEHFHSMRGRFKAFPFLDVLDYRVEASDGVLLDAGGSPAEFQLAKSYGSGADVYDRPITRPIVSTVAVYRLRSGVTTVITGSCTISATTGLVVIADGVLQSDDVLSWSGQFHVPCRYDTDELPAVIINRRPGDGGYDDLLVQCDAIPIVEMREEQA